MVLFYNVVFILSSLLLSVSGKGHRLIPKLVKFLPLGARWTPLAAPHRVTLNKALVLNDVLYWKQPLDRQTARLVTASCWI
ncbi:hypothetical protein HDV03_001706 [Kappamyces sp. JEL0829]|nr:hypothetical protein HDV03_001706 [Kappamyces sp. JEL0829]